MVPISGLVFPGKNGVPLDNIKRTWTTLREKAKLEHFTFHGLRHTFGQRLIDRRVDILTVRDLMGYADISTTQIYLSTATDKKREAVQCLI